MLHQEIVAGLTKLEIFRGLDRSQLEGIVRAGERIVFRPGQTIIAAGAPGDAAFLIAEGEAAIAVEDQGVGEVILPGALIGELAILVEHEYKVSVVCRTAVRTIKFTRAALH